MDFCGELVQGWSEIDGEGVVSSTWDGECCGLPNHHESHGGTENVLNSGSLPLDTGTKYIPGHSQKDRPDSDSYFTYIVWFVVGVLILSPWMSLLTYSGVYAARFSDPSLLLWMHIAFYASALPSLLLSIYLPPFLLPLLGLAPATHGALLARGVVFQLLSACVVAALPHVIDACGGSRTWEEWTVLGACLVLGFVSPPAITAAHALARGYAARAVTVFVAALQAPALIFLIVHKSIDLLPLHGTPSAWRTTTHWWLACGLTAAAAVALLVVSCTSDGTRAGRRLDTAAAAAARARAVAPYDVSPSPTAARAARRMSDGVGSMRVGAHDEDGDGYVVRLLAQARRSGPAVASLVVCAIGSALQWALMGRMPTCGNVFVMNAVYITAICEWGGRLLTAAPFVRHVAHTHGWVLLVLAGARFGLAIVTVFYAGGIYGETLRDVLLYIAFGFAGALNGVTTSASYAAAGMTVDARWRSVLTTVVTGFVVVTVVCFVAVAYGIHAALPAYVDVTAWCIDPEPTVTILSAFI